MCKQQLATLGIQKDCTLCAEQLCFNELLYAAYTFRFLSYFTISSRKVLNYLERGCAKVSQDGFKPVMPQVR